MIRSLTDSPHQVDLAESMAELAYLGTLLGLPPTLDPAYHLAYATFFTGATEGEEGVKAEGARETKSLESVRTQNVSGSCCRHEKQSLVLSYV